jgi:NADPH-dependent curcumin reductase CurA
MYRSVVLAKRPQSTIVPGETFAFKTKKVPTKADLKDGEVILQTLYLSLDPAMRGWLNGMLLHPSALLKKLGI